MTRRPLPKARPRRRPPHRIIIARGEHIRTFTLRPWAAALAFAIAVVVTIGYFGATGYLFFRDDLFAMSLARQASMQQAYEDRIAALHADIDRLTNRQVLNQQEVEAEVQKIAARQAALGERQDAIVGLTDAARAAGIPQPVLAPSVPAAQPAPPPKPQLKTSAALSLPSVIGSAHAAPAEDAGAWKPPLTRLAEIDADMDRLAAAQDAYVNAMATAITGRNQQIAAILKDIGRAPPPPPRTAPSSLGGPYVRAPAASDRDQFALSLSAVRSELDRYSTLRKTAAKLPLAAPVGDPSTTSGFGTRIDPFLGTPALHTGLDFRAAQGDPVAATGPGVVIAAEIGSNGGYGNMVDIDHGNGIVTRFGHLSQIAVKVGQRVAKGTIIGRAGATGRATGPHVHYEVRVNDDPVDPTRFLAAGEKIAPLL